MIEPSKCMKKCLDEPRSTLCVAEMFVLALRRDKASLWAQWAGGMNSHAGLYFHIEITFEQRVLSIYKYLYL